MYNIIITTSAEKDLRRLDRQVKTRIAEIILALADDPRPPGCLKVKSELGVWRLRVGEYRVGYRIDDKTQTVTVIRVGSRGDFYNN